MHFYKLDENGRIACAFRVFDYESACDEVKEEYLFTDKNIIDTSQGLMFEENVNQEAEEQAKQEIELQNAKANKIAQLKAERDAKELEPITYNGYRFDFDKDAIMRMELAERSLRGTNQGITWTDADNNRVNNVNADDLNAILIQGTIRSNELHIRYNELKVLVNGANTIEEVNAIEWGEPND